MRRAYRADGTPTPGFERWDRRLAELGLSGSEFDPADGIEAYERGVTPEQFVVLLQGEP